MAIRNRQVLFGIAPAIVLLISLTPKIVSSFQLDKTLMGPGFEYVRWRLAMDGALSVAAAMGDYIIFFLFMGTQADLSKGIRWPIIRPYVHLK